MDVPSGDNVWGVVIALVVVIGGWLVGRRGNNGGGSSGQLQVSPEIWQQLNDRIGELETRVIHLTQVVEDGQNRIDAGEDREEAQRQLLRIAVTTTLRANTRLRRAGLDEEVLDNRLLPYVT